MSKNQEIFQDEYTPTVFITLTSAEVDGTMWYRIMTGNSDMKKYLRETVSAKLVKVDTEHPLACIYDVHKDLHTLLVLKYGN